MSRTKQTSVKTTSGCAQRKFLATNSACDVRTQLSSRQRQGVSRRGSKTAAKLSYLNTDNVLGSFSFPTISTTTRFFPHISAVQAPHLATGNVEAWVSLQFSSDLDGAGISNSARSPISLGLCIDISNSMGWYISGDEEDNLTAKKKLDVVKMCVRRIFDHLDKNDTLSITVFCETATTLVRPGKCTPSFKSYCIGKVFGLHRSRGTNISLGMEHGMDTMEQNCQVSDNFGARRLFLLTDMLSNLEDERQVLKIAENRAEKSGIFTTVIGVDVDFCGSCVADLSKIRGARYVSVSNSSELQEIGTSFLHEVFPIAFDIHVGIAARQAWTIDRVCGSSELTNVAKGSREFSISSEFASPLCAPGRMKGGVLLLQVRKIPEGKVKDEVRVKQESVVVKKENVYCDEEIGLDISWRDASNIEHSKEMKAKIVQVRDGDWSQVGETLRKGVALVHVVDEQEAFCKDEGVGKSESEISRFQRMKICRDVLFNEMKAVKDNSLYVYGQNAFLRQIVEKIIKVEAINEGQIVATKARKVANSSATSKETKL